MCDKFTGSTLAGQEPNHSHQLLAGPWLQRAQDNEMYAGCPKKEFVQALVKLSGILQTIWSLDPVQFGDFDLVLPLSWLASYICPNPMKPLTN